MGVRPWSADLATGEDAELQAQRHRRKIRMPRHPLKPSERKNAEYIRSVLRELMLLTRNSNQRLLSYFLEMPYIEVSDILRDDRAFQNEIGSAREHP